jgi:ABC-type oligopeptide transport system ATPase subunit
MTLVINLIGGPGAGKSTTAAGLFFLMKISGLKVELVTEFAKELTYDENWSDLKKQLYVLSEQERRQRRLVDKVDYIITDSPLLLGINYVSDPREVAAVEQSARALFASYNNANFILKRVKPYAAYGRSQDENQAKAIDLAIRQGVFADQPIELIVSGNETAPQTILNHLQQTRLMI